MSKLAKVEQTKKAKTMYYSPLIDLLLTEKPKTKEELMEILNASSEREVRNLIAELSMHYPVIATSNQKGYRRAKNIDDLSQAELQKEIEEVEHQLGEHKSRVVCLKKKMKPLVAWLSVAKKKIEVAGNE